MARAKVSLTVVVAALACSAMAAGSASADWFVNGVKLSGATSLAGKFVVDGNMIFLTPALNLSIECTGGLTDAESANIESLDKGKIGSLKFLACNTTSPASGCALKEANQAISTMALLLKAFLGVGEEDRLLVFPESANRFAKITFSEANTCVFTGEELVTGSVRFGLPTGQLEVANQALVGLGSTENNSLEIGGANKAFFDGGKILLALANGLKWSFK